MKKRIFNRKKENLVFSLFSWNPVTGCYNNCPYCFAKQIALQNPDRYPKGFEYHFRSERLEAPKNTPLPRNSTPGSSKRRVFVGSMCDLFGDWVDKEVIEIILDVVKEYSQWTYLFLTKNPKRYLEFNFPENAWLGATVDVQGRVEDTEKVFKQLNSPIKFVFCEPLLDNVVFNDMSIFDWIIIGAQTKPEIQPPLKWVLSLLEQVSKAGCNIYIKKNLRIADKIGCLQEEPKII